MTVRERSLYYHLLRHTRIIGKESESFGLLQLAKALDVAESSVREDIRSLHERGCINIEEKSRLGHRVKVLLPAEIDGVVETGASAAKIDIETVDFFSQREFLATLLKRESERCFYCLRHVTASSCQLDHVVAQSVQVDNSYRNIVVSCHECNTTKQDKDAEDFVRSLYRKGVISQTEVESRLSSINALRAGRLVPEI